MSLSVINHRRQRGREEKIRLTYDASQQGEAIQTENRIDQLPRLI